MSRAGSLFPLDWATRDDVDALSDAAQALYLRLVTCSAQARSDGKVAAVVRRQQTMRLGARADAVMAELVKGEWVTESTDGSLYLTRWDLHNLAADEIADLSEKRHQAAVVGGTHRARQGHRDQRGRWVATSATSASPAVPLDAAGTPLAEPLENAPAAPAVHQHRTRTRTRAVGTRVPVEDDPNWQRFMDAWHGRGLALPPTDAQRHALADAVTDWNTRACRWVTEAPADTPVSGVVAYVLDRLHEARDQRRTEADAAEAAEPTERRSASSPTRASDVLADLFPTDEKDTP